MSANAEIIAELRRVLNERDEARRERDSYQRQLDAIGDALVTSIVKRIEPRLSRHPVTVIMAAGSLFAKIGEAIGCEFVDGDDLLEAAKKLVRERDEARREADRFRHGCSVEGDFVCPNEYAVSELTEERNFLRALKKNNEEDFTRVCKERDEARAEVERQRELKDYLRTWLSSEELESLRVKAAEHPLLWEEIHHLKAEVERLREALEASGEP